MTDLTPDNYNRVARLDELPQGKTLCVEVDGREILLCHTAEGVFAVDNLCSHAKAIQIEGHTRQQIGGCS